MAIEIKKELILNNNITLNSCYIRLEINLKLTGDKMDIKTYFYQNKNMFKLSDSSYLNPSFSTYLNVPYNINDGEPILFAHKKYVEYLTQDNLQIETVNIYDISGETLDSSKCIITTDNNGTTITLDGNIVLFDNNIKTLYQKKDNIITRTVIIREKLFDPIDVSILDLN